MLLPISSGRQRNGKDWDDVPDDIKNTFDRLGIPEAEQKWLGGVTAQYESEAVYHSIEKTWKNKVFFLDMDSGLKEYQDSQAVFRNRSSSKRNKFSASTLRLVWRFVHLRSKECMLRCLFNHTLE